MAGWLLLLCGAYPLGRAWLGARGMPLRHAVAWAWAAWLAWCWAAGGEGRLAGYLAACLTGCAGVAVLGARRPGVGAWDFVVAGLLLVLLRPLLEGMGELRLEAAHHLFLGAAIGVGVLNYVPTRQALAALAAGGCCAWWMASETVPVAGLATVPWLAWMMEGRGDDVGARWRAFRDAHGAFWAARLREQFNRAAANADLAVTLEWSGPVPPEEGGDLLRALLKRFGPEDGFPVPSPPGFDGGEG